MSTARRHIAPLAVAAGLGIVASGGGCNLVVGSGDYKIGIGDSGAVTMNEAGPTEDGGSTPPPPADAGMPPGPDATTVADSGGPPVDSGTTPDVAAGCLPSSDPNFQQLVRSCVLAVSCDPLFFDVTVSQCITTDYLHANLPSDCLSKITSCDDYYACTGLRYTKPAECTTSVSTDTDIGTCSNGIATSCFGGGGGIVSNCAAVGGTCVVFDEDSSDTGAGCQVLPSCTDSTSDLSTHCSSGTQLYTCLSTSTGTLGMATETCPSGTSCQTANGISGCYETTAPCTTPGASCSNGSLTTCQSQGTANEQYTTNCAAAGLQCSPGLGTATCAASTGCAVANCTETCTGNTGNNGNPTQLQVCVGGVPYLVDCSSLGFTGGCTDALNANDVDFYYCSN